MRPFLLLMALRSEARGIIESLGLSQVPKQADATLPLLWHEGVLPSGRPLELILHGVDSDNGVDIVGTQMSSVAAFFGIRRFQPEAIFNFGTCGALHSKGSQIGDVYLCSERVWFHTRRIPLSGWKQHGRGGFPCPEDVEELAQRLSVKSGVLSTTDSLDFPALDAKNFEQNNADVADMEGAAIAWQAQLHELPYYGLKAVTDLMDLDRKAGAQFLENIDSVLPNLTQTGVKLLKEVDWRENNGTASL